MNDIDLGRIASEILGMARPVAQPMKSEKPEVHDPYADESTPFLFGTKWLHQPTEDKKL